MTRYDKEQDFEDMCKAKAGGKRLNPFWQRLYEQNRHYADARIASLRNGAALPKDGDQYELDYPLMRDDDAPAMRVAVIRLVTNSRREGGGYFRQRWVYMPKAGDADNETRDMDPRQGSASVTHPADAHGAGGAARSIASPSTSANVSIRNIAAHQSAIRSLCCRNHGNRDWRPEYVGS